MKNPPRFASLVAFASIVAFVFNPTAQAADRYWSGGVSSDFNTAGNWVGGAVPVVGDQVFLTTTGQPIVMSAPASVQQLNMYTTGYTISGSSALTLGNNSNLVLNSTLTPGTVTISAPVILGRTTAGLATWDTQSYSAELIVSGDISATTVGAGITKSGLGILTLSGNNSFTGGFSLGGNGAFGASRVNINSNTALGTGTFTLGTGNGGVTVGNTSGAAHTLANTVTLNNTGSAQSNWNLPADGTGNLTFTGAATMGTTTTGAHTMNVIGGTLTLRGGLGELPTFASSLTKTGSGTLVLGGATYTGSTTFNGGAVVLDFSTGGAFTGALASPATALALNQTNFGLIGASSGTTVIPMGGLTATGNVQITVNSNGGAGTTLEVGSTWARSGNSTVNIILQGGNALVSSSPSAPNGLVVVGSAALATVTDAGGTGFATVSGGGTVDRYTTAIALTAAPSSTGNYKTTGFVLPGSVTANSIELVADGSGTGALDLGAGTLTLTNRAILMTGNNNFTIQNGQLGAAGNETVIHQYGTGELTISGTFGAGNLLTKTGGGTVKVTSTSSGMGLTTVNQGTLTVTGGIKALTVNGSTVATGGVANLQAAGAVTSGNINVAGTGTLNATVANAITGTGTVTVNGAGTTANLQQANNYSGTTTVTNGRLNLGNGAAIGTGTLSVNGAVLDNVSGTAMTLTNNNAISFAGGLIFTGTNNLNMGTGAVTLGAVRTIAVNNNTLTFGGSVGGAGGGITKIGDGILALNGANTYDGVTTVQGGVLRLNNVAALGTGNLLLNGGVVGLGASDFTANLGTLAGQVQWQGNAGFAAFGANRALNLGGAGALVTWGVGSFGLTGATSGNAILILGHATSDAMIDFQNQVSLGTGTITRTVQVENGSAAVDARISGVISSATATQTLLKTGRGTLDLTAANTYAGATQVVGGTLLICSTGSLDGSSVVSVAGGAHFRYDGTAAFNNSITLLAGAKFSYNSASDYTGSVLGLNAKLGGTNWNGSLSGQMIGLNQIYSTITPGNSPGNATTGSQTWAAGGSYDFEINDGASALVDNSKHDHLTITGSFGLDSSLTGGDFIVKLISLDAGNNAGLLANFNQFTNHVWELASFGSVTGQAFDANYFTVDTSGFQNAASGIWSVAMNGTNNGLNLVYTATVVPEPSTYALFAIGLSFVIWRHRRQAIRVVARV